MLKNSAAQTLQLLEAGGFSTPEGRWISLGHELTEAIAGTRLYLPSAALKLLEEDERIPFDEPCLTIEVTDETTQIAAQRLVVSESVENLVLLNFASARNPGGGFLNGAKAQEEDLARCSGIYACLLSQPAYYEANRVQESVLYTDHIIYSPNVPWFRTRSRDEPNTLFLASVITAPAPNAGVALERDPNCRAEIESTLRRRAGIVLAIAADRRHRNLLLGAWGCGVFRNNPALVADAFGTWLRSPRFAGAFNRVVFAVYDRSPQQTTFQAFLKRFSTDGS